MTLSQRLARGQPLHVSFPRKRESRKAATLLVPRLRGGNVGATSVHALSVPLIGQPGDGGADQGGVLDVHDLVVDVLLVHEELLEVVLDLGL